MTRQKARREKADWAAVVRAVEMAKGENVGDSSTGTATRTGRGAVDGAVGDGTAAGSVGKLVGGVQAGTVCLAQKRVAQRLKSKTAEGRQTQALVESARQALAREVGPEASVEVATNSQRAEALNI